MMLKRLYPVLLTISFLTVYASPFEFVDLSGELKEAAGSKRLREPPEVNSGLRILSKTSQPLPKRPRLDNLQIGLAEISKSIQACGPNNLGSDENGKKVHKTLKQINSYLMDLFQVNRDQLQAKAQSVGESSSKATPKARYQLIIDDDLKSELTKLSGIVHTALNLSYRTLLSQQKSKFPRHLTLLEMEASFKILNFFIEHELVNLDHLLAEFEKKALVIVVSDYFAEKGFLFEKDFRLPNIDSLMSSENGRNIQSLLSVFRRPDWPIIFHRIISNQYLSSNWLEGNWRVVLEKFHARDFLCGIINGSSEDQSFKIVFASLGSYLEMNIKDAKLNRQLRPSPQALGFCIHVLQYIRSYATQAALKTVLSYQGQQILWKKLYLSTVLCSLLQPSESFEKNAAMASVYHQKERYGTMESLKVSSENSSHIRSVPHDHEIREWKEAVRLKDFPAEYIAKVLERPIVKNEAEKVKDYIQKFTQALQDLTPEMSKPINEWLTWPKQVWLIESINSRIVGLEKERAIFNYLGNQAKKSLGQNEV